jgi:hypothetical protein
MDGAPNGSVLATIVADVKHVSRVCYQGQRFGDIDRWNDGWLPGSTMEDLAPPMGTANAEDAKEGDAS